MNADAEPALELRGVSKRFGDVVAVEDVKFSVRRGTVHALLGENGAGKSTLMRIAYGLEMRDGGSVRVLGRDLGVHRVRDAVAARVGMVHQHLSIVPDLSVVENLVLGGHGLFDVTEARDLLEKVSRESGLVVPADARAQDLSIVQQQRLEILKALARDATVLILDEPTAVLAPSEVEDLLRWIRSFAERGGAVVLVTHKLREALAVADHVTVLRGGRVVLEADAAAATEIELARAMFADEGPPQNAPAPVPSGPPIVRLDRVSILDADGTHRIRDSSFDVRAGEIVGIAAVEGSGHRHLLNALAGLRDATSGTLQLPPRIAFIPPDRVHEALIADFTLVENVALRDAGMRQGVMPWRAIFSRTAEYVERYRVTAPSLRVTARSLSGGNQQRLVVARELDGAVQLVVADNPTRGLDLRATAFVHDQIRAAARAGAAVIIHSSDLDELLSLATRVLVVFGGVVRETAGDRDLIGRAMLGAA